ncbi:MAG: EscU/YscU/HrcU family type III secretion system export apparatus switch protein [Polyangiaceae bacterium]|nr:EscU/YscU/HrcU family type III secretion system export apparatus switch protein [Polyangiaceae bacterium]
MSDRIETPTPQRLRRAREAGDVAVSPALTQAVTLLLLASLLPAAFDAVVARTAGRLQAAAAGTAGTGAAWMPFEVLALCAPLVLAGAAVALGTGLVQSGGVFATRPLSPNLARLDPLSGLASLASAPRALVALRSLVGAAVVLYVAVRWLLESAPAIADTAGSFEVGLALIGLLVRRLVWAAAIVGLALGAIDCAIVRHLRWRRLRMSRAEILRERRDSEGDPELSAARRRAHEALLVQTLVSSLETATVAVVDLPRCAAALRYTEGSNAPPLVVAQGQGEVARRLAAGARAHGVPVMHEPSLARSLVELELGAAIPETLYEPVAEVLRASFAEPQR